MSEIYSLDRYKTEKSKRKQKRAKESIPDGFVYGRPTRSGNYMVLYHGKIERDDYTIVGGHWWNVGENGGKDGVMYMPSSFKPLGI